MSFVESVQRIRHPSRNWVLSSPIVSTGNTCHIFECKTICP